MGSDRIESFIYAVVKAERHFTSALSPNPASSTTTAVASVPINKAFYFKRIERNDGYNFGIITFARERVGAWFVEYAPKQPFVRKHGLRISKGKRKPSNAFVKAIEETATLLLVSRSMGISSSRTTFVTLVIGPLLTDSATRIPFGGGLPLRKTPLFWHLSKAAFLSWLAMFVRTVALSSKFRSPLRISAAPSFSSSSSRILNLREHGPLPTRSTVSNCPPK